ncbi:MAG: hypothetical protein KGJ36_08000 [Acidobacteriota bacterium]|nr:hypothetical protein [Acidobacteriota bacterium]
MSDDDPVQRFLAQPAEHAAGDAEPDEPAAAPRGSRRSFAQWVAHVLFAKEPSAYSSISPRRADGTRTRPFFFNGNGRGR